MCVCVCVCVCVCARTPAKGMVLNIAHQCDSRANTNILEVLQELESDAFVLGHGMCILVLAALHREEPVEEVG